MSAPKIDVLMSAYNAGRFIKATIDSILAQSFRDFRLIVVDDGSTDDTPDILERLAAQDARIVVLTQPNGGIVSALNAGLALCAAPYLARHDADDLSDPNRFAVELAYLESNPECVAVSARARHIDAKDVLLGTVSTRKDPDKADARAIPAVEPYILQPLLMARLAAIKAVGGYRLLQVAEDSDLYWRLRAIGRLHNLQDCLGSYRIHDDSISSASIVRGRQAAIWSQLAALSAQRRSENKPDIGFDEALLHRISRAVSLQDMMALIAERISSDERRWLSLAASAKLLELCYYRPFEPDGSDITFIRQALATGQTTCASANCGAFQEALMSAAIRMAFAGSLNDALRLAGWKKALTLLARIAFRIAVPSSLKKRIKALFGRPVARPVAGAAR
ncbi:glycosyltransferase family 2 protein [Acetobacter sp. DsW_063]|uniref:glycosyltransferase family 2 protein n=1 Tax=Acetobacter sp. DsW_063 TaxID=1514894 RepID=UPI000B72FE26|nr:glycosyltransferase family 2 protein [Acetobacter sp. DsW_063]OUJ15722.1 hypothetical protein HK28_06775 [Acetobacter sp. DsW_063]